MEINTKYKELIEDYLGQKRDLQSKSNPVLSRITEVSTKLSNRNVSVLDLILLIEIKSRN